MDAPLANDFVVEEPAPKKKRPEVPLFASGPSAGDGLHAGEYERRVKAGLLDASNGSSAETKTGGPTPRALDVYGSEEAVGNVAPAAKDVSGSSPSESDGAAASEAVEEVGRKAKLGKRHSAVYGLEVSHGAGQVKKAIALRLEPLKPGLPEFERVLGEDRQSITIGQLRGVADVVIRDEAVSKKHCVLSLIGINGELGLSIIDHSTNGTFVNGKRLPVKQKRYRVRSGDKLFVKHPELDGEFGWTLDFGNTQSFFTRA